MPGGPEIPTCRVHGINLTCLVVFLRIGVVIAEWTIHQANTWSCTVSITEYLISHGRFAETNISPLWHSMLVEPVVGFIERAVVVAGWTVR